MGLDTRTAVQAGVDKIMIDLEINGKVERQEHLNTVISRHHKNSIADVASCLRELRRGEVLVRLNPVYDNTASEVEDVISLGAERLMLPMFRNASEVERFLHIVDGRVPVTLLLETRSAYLNLDEILRVDGDYDLHVGLNDLHLDMGLNFMFELLINGVVDKIAEACTAADVSFGIGGVAPLSLPAKLSPSDILSYHASVGSISVILSRDWRRYINDFDTLSAEVARLRSFLASGAPLNAVKLEKSIREVAIAISNKQSRNY